jgi:hypothetical protein
MLGLEESATLEVCMASVRRLLDHHGRTLDLKTDYVRRLEADQARNLAEIAAMRRQKMPPPRRDEPTPSPAVDAATD